MAMTPFQVQRPKNYERKKGKILYGKRIKFLQNVSFLHSELIKILTENHTIDDVIDRIPMFQ